MAKKPRKSKSRAKAPATGRARNGKAKKAKSKAVKRRPARTAATAARPELPKDLEARLMALALEMEKTMDALMLQALSEFADAWEEHFRTVKSLQDDDRMQLSVKPE